MRHKGPPVKQVSKYKKGLLSSQWRYIAHIILKCMSSKQATFSELSQQQASAMVGLIYKKNFSFSNMIFQNLRVNVQAVGGYKVLLYPRFLQIIFNVYIPGLPREGDILKFSHMNLKVFSFMKNRAGQRIVELFPHMVDDVEEIAMPESSHSGSESSSEQHIDGDSDGDEQFSEQHIDGDEHDEHGDGDEQSSEQHIDDADGGHGDFDVDENDLKVAAILKSLPEEAVSSKAKEFEENDVQSETVFVNEPRIEETIEEDMPRNDDAVRRYAKVELIVYSRKRKAAANDDTAGESSKKLKSGQQTVLEVDQDAGVNQDIEDNAPLVLLLLVKVNQDLASPDYLNICQGLMFLDQPEGVASVLEKLLRSENKDDASMAFQIGFDLIENEHQAFLLSVRDRLSSPKLKPELPVATETDTAQSGNPSGSEDTQMADETQTSITRVPESDPAEVTYAERLAKMEGILSGDTSTQLTLQFLYSHNKFDLRILKTIKQSIEMRNNFCHSAMIYANALMHTGTTVDTFLRENLDWLSRATNWEKFSATAGLGVIHRGHLQQGRSLMAPYLPQIGSGGGGSPYSEGGALYALGLIHANHGEGIKQFLRDSLRSTNVEVVQHGACLGLGLSALGTADEEIYDKIKSVLYTDSAVAGEGAGISMGLLMVGTASEKASEMLVYAHETQHEKIIRGLSLGIALTVYGREEADTFIEQMTRDQDPILRYGGMYALGLAYSGTANNKAIGKLLHSAVSDVSDDVRRTAVLALGFVMYSEPEQMPRMVSLLSESYNPHVRYGAAMAVGISCAGTGLSEAISLLEPLTSDVTDFVRQVALISMAMVLIQISEASDSRVGAFRRQLEKIIVDKHEDTMSKMGAILASGILDAGGKNVTIRLLSKTKHDKMNAVIGLAVFSQFWY